MKVHPVAKLFPLMSERGMRIHKIAAAFPPLPRATMRELVRDIAQHGLRRPIPVGSDVDPGLLILDADLYAAYRRARVSPTYEFFVRTMSDKEIANIHLRRRQLTISQRAMIAAMLTKKGA